MRAGLLHELLARDATFVAFRIPGGDVRIFVQNDHELEDPVPGEPCFVIAPFLPDGPVTCIRPDHVLNLDTNVGDLQLFAPPPQPPRALQGAMDRSAYERAVTAALGLLEKESMTKIVVARTFTVPAPGISAADLFLAAERSLTSAFVVLLHTAHHGTWLGASPERLLMARQGYIEVDSIAGTMVSTEAPRDPDAWREKERLEQDVVTVEILRSLLREGARELRYDRTVKQAGGVSHLHSVVRGVLNGHDPLKVARGLHPTPAVGGVPKKRALEHILELEPGGRSLYTGYWGPVNGTEADLYVNLRCMRLQDGIATLFAGAGITQGSSARAECDEVERKSRTWADLIEAQRAGG